MSVEDEKMTIVYCALKRTKTVMSTLVFLIFGVTLVYGGVTTRTSDEIIDFKNFLDKSEHGAAQEPLNSKIGELQSEWERSGKFEGDIILTDEQKKNLVNQFTGERNAILNGKIWPNKTVYYSITPGIFTAAQVKAIQDALAYISKVSCIVFKQSTSSDNNYIIIQGKTDGCYSNVGRTGGSQVLNLSPSTVGSGCFRHGTIVHEFLHALGFYHMQSTHDRDEFVRIVWDKIQAGASNNFNKYTSTQVSNLGVPYDYGSVMHYSEYGFSTDGSKTIVPLKATSAVIGQRVEMSAGDFQKLKSLYSC